MSYSSNCQSKWSNGRPVKWSTCSQEDFKKHYDSLKNNWCMTSKPIKKDGTGNFCRKYKKKIWLITYIHSSFVFHEFEFKSTIQWFYWCKRYFFFMQNFYFFPLAWVISSWPKRQIMPTPNDWYGLENDQL